MSESIVIKNGTIINRASQLVADVRITNGLVAEVGKNLKGDTQLDASGCIVSSGFVDLHVHLREPGKEEAETIETGSRAGALGGYTALVVYIITLKFLTLLRCCSALQNRGCLTCTHHGEFGSWPREADIVAHFF